MRSSRLLRPRARRGAFPVLLGAVAACVAILALRPAVAQPGSGAATSTQTLAIDVDADQAGVATRLELEVTGQFESLARENGRLVLRARRGELSLTPSSFHARTVAGQPGRVERTQAFFSLDGSGRCRAVSLVVDFAPGEGRTSRQITLTLDLIVESAYSTPRAALVVVDDVRRAAEGDRVRVTLDLRFHTAELPFRSLTWLALRQQVFDERGMEVRLPREELLLTELVDRPMGSGETRRASASFTVPAAMASGRLTWSAVAIGQGDAGQLVAEPVRREITAR